MSTVDAAAHALNGCRHVLLDFDGPVCSIFAGVGAPSVAAALRDMLAQHSPVPAELDQVDDPLAVLRLIPSVAPHLTDQVEAALRDAEVAAAATARPTPDAEAFLAACRESGRLVSIVSNNSRAAVEAYLTSRSLIDSVDLVVARTDPNPALMKPSPHLLEKAMAALDTSPAESVLVGDSTTDIHAAQAAGVGMIGYANKPGKAERLLDDGADAVVTTMAELAAAVTASPVRTILR